MPSLSRRRTLAIAGSFVGGATATTLPSLSTSTDPIDVFVIGGQSNAVGQGDAADSPVITDGSAEQFYHGYFLELNDPVGDADTGSAWPAFHREYHRLTGRRAMYIPAAFGGSGLAWESRTSKYRSWSEKGILRDKIDFKLKKCFEKLEERGDNYQYRGLLWSQGERDAGAVKNETITLDDYWSALLDFQAWYTNISRIKNHELYIFQTGHLADGDDDAYAGVRKLQSKLARKKSDVKIASYRQKTFPDQELMIDGSHYSQAGYNEMGRTGAKFVASDRS